MASKNLTISELPAYHSYPDDAVPIGRQRKKHPGLILIHEIWGLDAHIRDVADRFAAQGYSVLAPNLFHNQPFEDKVEPGLFGRMQDPATKDEAQKEMRALLAPMQSPEFAEKVSVELKLCVDYLSKDDHVSDRIAVLGFCFGGTYSFHLAAHDHRIKAAVPFYGQPPKLEEIPLIKCPVLAFYGDQDTRLMESLPELKKDMKEMGRDFEAVVYPGTGHAFFNDTNKRMYNAAAAADSWDKSLAFLRKNLV